MTATHIFFIPAVFFLGFLAGAIVSTMAPVKERVIDSIQPRMRFKGSYLAASFGIFVIAFFLTHMFPILGGAKMLHTTLGHQPLFDQQTSASADEVYMRLEAFGEGGREAYKHFTYTGDVIFPLSFLVFLLVLALFVGERTMLSPAIRRTLLLIPVLWFCSDMIENAVIYWLTSQFPVRHNFIASGLGWLTNTKFLLLLSSITFPTVSLVYRRRKGSVQ